jgi:hypothetical protein
MGNGFLLNRSRDITYSWSTRWQRDLHKLENQVNSALPPSRLAPFNVRDISSYGRGAGAFVLLKLADDFRKFDLKKKEFEVESRVHEITVQFLQQLQQGQEAQVHISINLAPEVRVTTLAVEPVRTFPQLRAAESRLQNVWNESSPNSSIGGSETVTVRVRKPFLGESEQCPIQELSARKAVTTEFAIAERNGTPEVRHLQLPPGSLNRNEVAEAAPQLGLPERPWFDAERQAFERRMAAVMANQKAASEAVRRAVQEGRDNPAMPSFDTQLR